MASNSTITLTGIGGVDTRDFAKFAKALRSAAPEIAVDLRTELRAAGDIVAQEAKKNADEVSPDGRISKTIKTRVSGATVSVVMGGPGAPHAAPIEHGGQSGSFRHPVFGNKQVWVEQAAHPMLHPALTAAKPAAEEAAIHALDKAVTSVVAHMGV